MSVLHSIPPVHYPICIKQIVRCLSATAAHAQTSSRNTSYQTVFCSTHRFIVKGGEDLRLDERIQQLWRLLTGLAGRHPAAAKRGLATALTTFDVIPMTPTLGVMAFVQVGVAAGACRVSQC